MSKFCIISNFFPLAKNYSREIYVNLINFYSAITLLPGDVILTGTPYGIGSSQNPPQSLLKGDILETEIQDIGRMTHRIV